MMGGPSFAGRSTIRVESLRPDQLTLLTAAVVNLLQSGREQSGRIEQHDVPFGTLGSTFEQRQHPHRIVGRVAALDRCGRCACQSRIFGRQFDVFKLAAIEPDGRRRAM